MNPYEKLPAEYDAPPLWMQESLRSHGAGDSVRLVWDKPMKRWEVQTFGRETKVWHYAFLWATFGKDGSVTPKELPATAKPILDYLHAIDDARFGMTPEKNRAAALAEMDEPRRKRVAELAKMRRDHQVKLGTDYAKYLGRSRVISAPGYIQKRAHAAQVPSEIRQAVAEYKRLSRE